MTADIPELIARLRRMGDRGSGPRLMHEAADALEAQSTERQSLIEAALDHRATASRALARESAARAVIAEALAALSDETVSIANQRYRARNVLSRGVQDTTEPVTIHSESEGQFIDASGLPRGSRVVIEHANVTISGIGLAEPERRYNLLDSRRPWGIDAAEPWTDPEPWIDIETGLRWSGAGHDDSASTMEAFAPRTREQYDAEEGAK